MTPMNERTIAPKIRAYATRYPVVTLTGPRQSGKTTLCRALFPDLPYVNLESPVDRDWATSDPAGFIHRFHDGAVLDEVQRAPELLSVIQVAVDEDPRPGRFILTGSQNFRLRAGISQSLAGRTALATLLPFSVREAYGENPPTDLWETVWRGFFPRIHDKGLPPMEAISFYVETYLERDIRDLLNVRHFSDFFRFLRLCAGRTAQTLNASTLAADVGIPPKTALEWMSILEAGYIVRRLPPWFANIRKRLSKSPKIHFLDTGLVCCLLGIQTPEQLRDHPLRGAIFETFIVGEAWKRACNLALPDTLFHYRDGQQREIDLVEDRSGGARLIEIKSGETPSGDWGASLRRIASVFPGSPDLRIVYGGDSRQIRSGVEFLPWRDFCRESGGGLSEI